MNKIEKQVEIKASISIVWIALTNYVHFGTWFRVKLDGPFEVGKETIGHITYPGYEHLKWTCVVKEMQHEKLFSFTWHPFATDPDVDYSNEEPTLVEFRLEKINGGTRVTVTESGFDKIPESRRNEAFRMNDRGWTEQMRNISSYVEQTTQAIS